MPKIFLLMGLYNLFSCNVEIQYKSCLFSKATLFTAIVTLLNIVIPFIIAYRSRGFWLKNYNFYEQPIVRFKYEYLFIGDTSDLDYVISCGEMSDHLQQYVHNNGNCKLFKVTEIDNNHDGRNDLFEFILNINVPTNINIVGATLLLAMDVQFETVCPMQIQSLAVIMKSFNYPPTGVLYNGDLLLYQRSALPCIRNHIDTKYNSSVFDTCCNEIDGDNNLDEIFNDYYKRDVTFHSKEMYSRTYHGYTANFEMRVNLHIPELAVRYKPHLWQELKWAWPQYLSLVIIFYWMFRKIKQYVFDNRLILAWKVIPWKKSL